MANTSQTSQTDLKKSHQHSLLPVDQNNSSLTQLIKAYLPKKEVDKVVKKKKKVLYKSILIEFFTEMVVRKQVKKGQKTQK